VKRYAIRTYGCQMNQHDTEKVSNLLHHAGWRPAAHEDDADLVLVNTCSIREKAEHRLYTDLGILRGWKAERAGRLVGVGGCVAQHEGDDLLRRFPQVDFVFGTHNVRRVPELVAAAEAGERRGRLDEVRDLSRFELPERHPEYAGESPGRAFLTVMEGCDLFCSFCIVPRTRGREISRPADAIEAEARALAARGVCELTLLGQTVNAWGRHDRRRRSEGPGFGELVRRLAAIPGIERIRYTSPHPAFFDADLVRAHRELESLCPHVHLPLQSGSDAVLARMRRRYAADDFRRVVEALRGARPDVALTTDLIVGFPGESDADFQATLDLVAEVGFVDAYSFKYSPRPGTAGADLPDAVPAAVAQERLAALQALQRSLTLAYHRSRVGSRIRILVEGESRRGGQLAGRDPWHRVVNVPVPPAGALPAAGRLLAVRVVDATPHSLLGEVEVKENPARADEPGVGGIGRGAAPSRTGTFAA
jgi:tRNA-2-methylthio-N6-dimethylallyladenosine synthase